MYLTIHRSLPQDILEKYDETETQTLGRFIEQLSRHNIELLYQCIDDTDDTVGLELFFNSEKVAEVYCAENWDGVVTGMLNIYCKKNWHDTQILGIKSGAKLICEMLSHDRQNTNQEIDASSIAENLDTDVLRTFNPLN